MPLIGLLLVAGITLEVGETRGFSVADRAFLTREVHQALVDRAGASVVVDSPNARSTEPPFDGPESERLLLRASKSDGLIVLTLERSGERDRESSPTYLGATPSSWREPLRERVAALYDAPPAPSPVRQAPLPARAIEVAAPNLPTGPALELGSSPAHRDPAVQLLASSSVEPRRTRIAPFVVLGTSVAAGIVGSVFLGRALDAAARKTELENFRVDGGFVMTEAMIEQQQDILTNGIAANVLISVAAAGAITSLVLLIAED